MAKSNLTLKGFRDFMPSDMLLLNEVVKRLRTVFEIFGYQEIQTPALERQEVLTGKYGSEAEKQVYLFSDPGKRKVGLKYDSTVPLARFMTGNLNIPLPFKRYQIQPSWRAENTQRGRYREFRQADVDIVGSSSSLSDAEILAMLFFGISSLGFTDFKIKVNSRSILNDIMAKAGIPTELRSGAIILLDKLDKKSSGEVMDEMSIKGYSKKQIDSIFHYLGIAKPDVTVLEACALAESMGAGSVFNFEPSLSRGLDYYTGIIFESFVEKPNIGSITGGGRYDNLLKDLGGPDLPAVGAAFGLDRIMDVIKDLDLWKNIRRPKTEVLVTVFSKDQLFYSIKITGLLRSAGINTELYSNTQDRLDKQLKYADKKKLTWTIIAGTDEVKTNTVTVKNLTENRQYNVPIDQAINMIRDNSGQEPSP